MNDVIRPILLAVLMAGLALGCAHQNDRFANDSPAADQPPARPDETPEPDEPRPVRPDQDQPPADAPPPHAEPELDEAQIQKALDNAVAAAVAAEGDSPCERSYNAMVAMRDSLVADLGDQAAQDLPERGRFIDACEELPEPAQRCMDVAHAMENQVECQQIMEAVPAERRRALEEVLQGH
jgi:hypothetical protein